MQVTSCINHYNIPKIYMTCGVDIYNFHHKYMTSWENIHISTKIYNFDWKNYPYPKLFPVNWLSQRRSGSLVLGKMATKEISDDLRAFLDVFNIGEAISREIQRKEHHNSYHHPGTCLRMFCMHPIITWGALWVSKLDSERQPVVVGFALT